MLPQVLSIVTLDGIFKHTTPRGFRGLHIEDSDESQYVKMMLNGIFSSDTLPPYKFRWLTPLLTGSLNILPVKDLSGFTVLNFASLIMTSIVLVQILQELRVNKLLSLLVPVFLFNAYLGKYAAWNHYLTDPANYMFFSIYLWCLLDAKRYTHLSWLLMLGVLNSEKSIYWLPIILIILMKTYHVKEAMLKALIILGPAAVVFLTPRLFLEEGPISNVTRLQLSAGNIPLLISLPFSYIYFPFSFLTILFVLGFNRLPTVLKIASLILLPIYAQVLIAGYRGDVDRMIAYAFIIFVPASLYYVQKLFEAVRYDLGVVMTIPFLLVAYFNQKYTLPLCLLILLAGTELIPYLTRTENSMIRTTFRKDIS